MQCRGKRFIIEIRTKGLYIILSLTLSQGPQLVTEPEPVYLDHVLSLRTSHGGSKVTDVGLVLVICYGALVLVTKTSLNLPSLTFVESVGPPIQFFNDERHENLKKKL